MYHHTSNTPQPGRGPGGSPVKKPGNGYNPAIHHRRSIRLKGYDYAQPGLYFITLNCQNRKPLFGKIRNGEMTLSIYGQIVHDEWLQTPLIRPETSLEAFVVMPDHFHAIIRINEAARPKREGPATFTSPSRTIGAIIRGFKGATTKKIKERWLAHMRARAASQEPGPTDSARADSDPPRRGEPGPAIDIDQKIWQRDYYEIIIRDGRALRNITRYIINNPSRAAARADSDPPRREASDAQQTAGADREASGADAAWADSDPPRQEAGWEGSL
jgi:putative transposase